MASVSHAMRQSGSRHSDQGEVWSEIDRKFSAMASTSDTSAMADMYQDAAPALEEYVDKLQPETSQVGAFYFLHGGLIGDLFDKAATYANLNGKLIKSYAIDVLEAAPVDRQMASLSEALRFLKFIEDGHGNATTPSGWARSSSSQTTASAAWPWRVGSSTCQRL